MVVSKAYGVYGVVFDSTALGGVTNIGLPSNTITEEIATDGNVYARFQSMISQAPVPTFTTHNIAAAMALCGVSGTDISGLSNGLIMYAQQRADGGIRSGASLHLKYVVDTGLVVPTNLSATQDASASISYAATSVSSDGTNAPLTVTDLQSLTATTDTERFGIGTVTLGSNVVTGVTGIDIDFGVNVNALSADGDVFPTFSSVDLIQPSITIRTLDASLGADNGSLPLAGVLGTYTGAVSDTTIQLDQRTLGGKYTAGTYVQFAMNGMITIDDSISASGNDVGEMAIKITPIYDGVNVPIVYSYVTP
jgi:hypothetical protein